MANAVTSHKFVSGKADGADTTLVRPSNWNADHNFSGGTDGQILSRDSTQVDGANWTDPTLAGTSKLSFVNSTTIQLGIGTIPLRIGATAWITRRIPVAVTIANTGLTANTLYYVYAFDNAGVTTLEVVTTAHVTDSVFGAEIKSGDGTRTYVGVLQTGAGVPGVFVSGQVNPWFGPRTSLQATWNAQTTASASLVDVPGATVTFIPHSANSTFLVQAAAAAAVTNVASTNTAVQIQILLNGVAQSITAQNGSAPSAAGGSGWQGAYSFTGIMSPAAAAAFVTKLQFLATGTATASCGGGALIVTEIV